MKQNARAEVKPGGKVHRQFPGLTADDVAALNALEPDAAKELENLIRSQHRGQSRFRERCPVGLHEMDEARAARWSHGAGGGRRRPRRAPAP